MELPVFDVAKTRREAPADQAKQREDMIAGAAGVSEQLLNFQVGVVVDRRKRIFIGVIGSLGATIVSRNNRSDLEVSRRASM